MKTSKKLSSPNKPHCPSSPKKPKRFFTKSNKVSIPLDNRCDYSIDEIYQSLKDSTKQEICVNDIKIYIDTYVHDYDFENDSRAYVDLKPQEVENPHYDKQMLAYQDKLVKYKEDKERYKESVVDYHVKKKEYEDYIKSERVAKAKRVLEKEGIL